MTICPSKEQGRSLACDRWSFRRVFAFRRSDNRRRYFAFELHGHEYGMLRSNVEDINTEPEGCISKIYFSSLFHRFVYSAPATQDVIEVAHRPGAASYPFEPLHA